LRPGKCTLTSFKGKHGFYKIRKSAHFLQFRLWNLETPSIGITEGIIQKQRRA